MELICFFLTWNGASVIAMSHALSATTQFRVRWPQIKAQFWTFEQYTVSSPRNAQLGHLDLVLLLSFKRNVKSIREKKKITAEQFARHDQIVKVEQLIPSCPLAGMGKNQCLIGLMSANWGPCEMTLPNRDGVALSCELPVISSPSAVRTLNWNGTVMLSCNRFTCARL